MAAVKPGDEFVDLSYPDRAVVYRAGRVTKKTVVTGSFSSEMTFRFNESCLVIINEETASLILKLREAEKAIETAVEALRPYFVRIGEPA